MAITFHPGPANMPGSYQYDRWASTLIPGKYYKSQQEAMDAERIAQGEVDRKTAQETANTSVTQNQATHIPTADALASSRLSEEGRQFDVTNARQTADSASADDIARAKLGQTDPRLLSTLQGDAEARRLAQLPSYMSAFGLGSGTGGGGGIGGTVEYGGVDADAARAATYAKAKDQIANQQRASLTALQNVAAQRGLNVAGGKNPALQAQEGAIIGNAQGQLGDVTRNQTVDDLAAQQHAADKKFEGGITQRGQNMSVIPSLMGLVQSRGLY